MTDYYTIVTDKGKAKLAAAIAGQQTIKLTHLAIGDGGGQIYNPTASQNALNHEVKRVYLSSLAREGDNIIVEAIIPEDIGGFYIRELGIYDSDNALFAIGKMPETYKPTPGSGLHKQIMLRLFFAVSDSANAITLEVDPLGTIPTKSYVDTAVDAAKTALTQQLATKLPLTGGTLTGLLTLSGAPTATLHATTKAYADTKLPLAGGTMTGAITLSGDPTAVLHAATKQYVDAQKGAADSTSSSKVSKSGDTMTGLLTLSGAPTANLHAATKAYADTKLPLAGGTLTGNLTVQTFNPHIIIRPETGGGMYMRFYSTPEQLLVWDIRRGTNDESLRIFCWESPGVITQSYFTLLKDGTLLSSTSTNSTDANSFAKKNYVDTETQKRLPLTGGTLTGLLTLSGAPTANLHAATKAYADTKLPLTGGTLTGAITLSGDPAVALQAATKQYADRALYPATGAATYASSTLTLDCSKGQVFEYTLTANTTISITNKPASSNHMIMLKLTNGGNYTVTQPTGCKYPGGNKTLTTNGLDHICYYLDSAGGVVANILKDIK